jgi:dual specificity tyrosine-phosphorylation-regulated kinase 2/3/4
MWSLGSILVELLSGFPLWLSLKSRVQTLSGNSVVNYGLFGVAGRNNLKIMTRQLQVFSQGYQSLERTLRKGFAF